MSAVSGRLVGLAAAALLAVAAPALATPLLARIPAPGNVAGAQIAVDPGGRVALLYSMASRVRLWRSDTGRAEPVPVPRRAVVEGVALDADGLPVVLTRRRAGCSDMVAMVGQPGGGWRSEALGGRARDATIAADPSGLPVVAGSDCHGFLMVRARLAPARWSSEWTGIRTLRAGRVALVAGPDGRWLAGIAGREAAIAERVGGAWVRLPLPGGPLLPGEEASTLSLALDPALQPVTFLVRGPASDRPVGPSIGSQASAWQLEAGAWVGFETLAEPMALAGAGAALAMVDRAGRIEVEAPGLTTALNARARRVAIGPLGALFRLSGTVVAPVAVIGI